MLEMLASVFLSNDSPMMKMQFTMPGQRGWSGGEAGSRQDVVTPLFPYCSGFPTTGKSEQVEQLDSIFMKGWITHDQFTVLGCTQGVGALVGSWCCGGGPRPGYWSSDQTFDDGAYIRRVVPWIHYLIATAQ